MLTKRVQVVFCLQIRLMRFFWRSKQAQTNRLVVDFDFCQPLMVFFANAWKAAFVVSALAILRILRIGSFSQVADSVVASVAVNVVQLMRRPLPVNVQPRQTVGGVQYIVEPDRNVAVFHAATRCVSRPAPPARHVPTKNPGIRVIQHKRFEAVLRDIFAVHDLNNIMRVRVCQA